MNPPGDAVPMGPRPTGMTVRADFLSEPAQMTDDRRSSAADAIAPPAAGHTTHRAQNALVLAIAAGFPLLFFALGWAFIHANSQTSDEAIHLTAGYSYLLTHDFRLNREHPPFIKELAGLAVYLRYRLPFEPDPSLWAQALRHSLAVLFIARDFVYRSPVPEEHLLRVGRLPNLALGTALVALVGWWAYRLWGRRAALVALALAALEPNLIAHSSLVTTDLGAALFTFLAVYLLWELGSRPSWWRLEGVGIATGLALASKYSAVLVLALAAVVAAGHVAQGGSLSMPGRPRPGGGLIGRAREAAWSLGLIAAVAGLTVAACYFFRDLTGWWVGFGDVAFHQEAGHVAFFLGSYSTTGWWSYFLVAFLIKTPLGSLFLIATSLALYRAGRP